MEYDINRKMNQNNIAKLNLVMTYPIHWSIRHIMEDYVQNFYDVSEPESFSKEFTHQYNEEKKLLRFQSKKGFSLEWLKYIGASSKKGTGSRHTAGKFGEGFKIASLCAYRDHHIRIRMESRDWRMEVVSVPGEIAGQKVEFLGYHITERSYADDAVLYLENIEQEAYHAFQQAMKSFYYPENPIFGECIVKTSSYAVYKMNQAEKRDKDQISGKVFASMQERAEIRNVPLIFCNHTYEPDREDDRDRKEFYNYDIEEAVYGIVSRLEGEALREVFMAFQPYWLRPDSKGKYGPGWNRLLRKMVWKIAENDILSQKICDFLIEDYIADMDSYIVKYDRNRYKTALAWFRSSEYHESRQILPYYFSDLGIENLYTLCKRHDGFHVISEPDQQQQKLIRILEHIARDIFTDFICYETLPECKVIANRGTPNEGLACAAKADRTVRNLLGLKVVYTIAVINLREELLSKSTFSKAVVVYMHELLHQFGTDTGGQFRIAILAMNYRIMECSRKLEAYEKEWERHF